MKPESEIEGQKTFVLIDTNGSTIAIALEAIDDQRQVVIKSLEGNYGTISGISAATILGDGKIALIIDPEALPELEASRRSKNKVPTLEEQF